MTALLPSAFGLLMVVTAAGSGGTIVLGVLAAAAIAVAVGLFDRRAATAAVLASTVALALSEPTPLFAALCGMSAAVYLVTRHAVGSGAAPITIPSAAGLLGFALVGLVATAVPLPVNWIPLLAPAIMAAVLIVAALPMLADRGADPRHSGADDAAR